MIKILERRVLVLNKNWTVIGHTILREAITSLAKGNSKAVCSESYTAYTWEEWISNNDIPSTEHYIKTPNLDIRVPEIIKLSNYEDFYNARVKFSQRAVYRRDKYQCQYCLKKFTPSLLSLDHVIPRSKGGETSFENCVTACLFCNCKKGSKLLGEIGMKLQKSPEKPTWNPVFHVRPNYRPKSWKPFLDKEW